MRHRGTVAVVVALLCVIGDTTASAGHAVHSRAVSPASRRLAAVERATSQFSDFLQRDSFFVAGVGHDFEPDGDVDLADYAAFQRCFGSTTPECRAVFDFDARGVSDGVVNRSDLGGFELRMRGPNQAGGGGCPRRTGGKDDGLGRTGGNGGGLRADPVSGTFALHGRPIDVLPDGKVLLYVRARHYDPANGRWLQRDPIGYADGGNLYEGFRGNAERFSDPDGKLAEEIFNFILSGRFLSNEEIERATERGYSELAGAQSGLLLDLRNAGGALIDPVAVLYIPRGFNEGYRQPIVEGVTARFESFINSQVAAGADIDEASSVVLLSALFFGDLSGVTQLGEGIFAVDLATGEVLSTGESIRRSVQGGSTIVIIVAGPKALQNAQARSAVAREQLALAGGMAGSEAAATRARVLANIAESQAARTASRFGSRTAIGTRTTAQLVQDIATRADAWGVRQGLTGTPQEIGTAKHFYARDLLDRYQNIFGSRGLSTEVRYVNQTLWEAGKSMPTAGSVILDVVEGNPRSPTAVFDYKFGKGQLWPGRVAQIRRVTGFHNVPIMEVRP